MKRTIPAIIAGCGLLLTACGAAGASDPLGAQMTNLMDNYQHYVPKGTLQMFGSENDAEVHCEADPVVWVDTQTHLAYVPGSAQYGHTVHGGYVCEHEAISAGNRVIQPK